MLMLPLSWLHELRELLRQNRIMSLQVTLSLCDARLPKALGEFLQVYTTSRSSSAINQSLQYGRAGWPALVQIRAINVPVGFYCSGNVRVVFLSYHVGNSASMSPVEFSKRPMSAVANYPFHTPTSRLTLKKTSPSHTDNVTRRSPGRGAVIRVGNPHADQKSIKPCMVLRSSV